MRTKLIRRGGQFVTQANVPRPRRVLRETIGVTHKQAGADVKAIIRREQPGVSLQQHLTAENATLISSHDGKAIARSYEHATADEGRSSAGYTTVSFRSVIVVRLTLGTDNTYKAAEEKLRFFVQKAQCRATPVHNAEGYWSLTGLSQQSVNILRSMLGWKWWISSVEERSQSLPGGGTVEHVARKPKAKRTDFLRDKSTKPKHKPASDAGRTIFLVERSGQVRTSGLLY